MTADVVAADVVAVDVVAVVAVDVGDAEDVEANETIS